MLFKSEAIRQQFYRAPSLLRAIAMDLETLSKMFGIDPVMTRVTDPVDDESGVHLDYRGEDFRIEYTDDKGNKQSLYTENQYKAIENFMNYLYPRKDGFKTCIVHDSKEGLKHFHCQAPDRVKTGMPQ